jgi:signal transduction histidine kinase
MIGPTCAARLSHGRRLVRRPAAWCLCAVGVTLLAIPIAMVRAGCEADCALRHAYLVPVLAAALAWGISGGAVAAIIAILLDAPFVLPRIEQTGMTAASVEGLATFATILALGTLTGGLVSWGRRERDRYDLVITLQRSLANQCSLSEALGRVRDALVEALPATDVALVVRDGPECETSCGRRALAAEAAVAETFQSGTPRFIRDTGGEPRPRRVLSVPLLAREGTVGVLTVTRLGEMGASERAIIATLGAHLGLGLENARLVARQRRFAAELADKVASATARLQTMDRAKSMFVAVVSHELRTPLTALVGYSELLTARTFEPPEVRRFAGTMRREAERLVRIVDDLLDLSRLERGLPPPLRRTAIDVEPALHAAVESFRHAGAAHHVEIDCAGDLPRIDADADALDRVLRNLISNAIKYSPPGEIRVAARRAGDFVELDVEDHGRGIPPETVTRMFEPYFRDPEAATAVRGTGIGLAVVKTLIEAHGGSVSVTSAPSSGTRVTFTLPAVS